MTDRVEKIGFAVLVIAAATMAGTLVSREVRSSATPAATATRPPVLRDGWTRLLRVGTLVGDSTAPVKIIEFTDLECPYCREFSRAFNAVRRKHGRAVALWFIHYPLPNHRFARRAALAAECARAETKFTSYIDALFDKQDSIGLKPWTSYAYEAGLLDTASFARCVSSTDRIPAIDEGLAVGAEFDVQGTPTVLINGWQFAVPPSEQQLEQVVRNVLAGRHPVKGI